MCPRIFASTFLAPTLDNRPPRLLLLLQHSKFGSSFAPERATVGGWLAVAVDAWWKNVVRDTPWLDPPQAGEEEGVVVVRV